MSRIIVTFKNLFTVLKAEKLLAGTFSIRPVPTPPRLASSICGMSIELLDPAQESKALAALANGNLPPTGVHYLD